MQNPQIKNVCAPYECIGQVQISNLNGSFYVLFEKIVIENDQKKWNHYSILNLYRLESSCQFWERKWILPFSTNQTLDNDIC